MWITRGLWFDYLGKRAVYKLRIGQLTSNLLHSRPKFRCLQDQHLSAQGSPTMPINGPWLSAYLHTILSRTWDLDLERPIWPPTKPTPIVCSSGQANIYKDWSLPKKLFFLAVLITLRNKFIYLSTRTWHPDGLISSALKNIVGLSVLFSLTQSVDRPSARPVNLWTTLLNEWRFHPTQVYKREVKFFPLNRPCSFLGAFPHLSIHFSVIFFWREKTMFYATHKKTPPHY